MRTFPDSPIRRAVQCRQSPSYLLRGSGVKAGGNRHDALLDDSTPPARAASRERPRSSGDTSSTLQRAGARPDLAAPVGPTRPRAPGRSDANRGHKTRRTVARSDHSVRALVREAGAQQRHAGVYVDRPTRSRIGATCARTRSRVAASPRCRSRRSHLTQLSIIGRSAALCPTGGRCRAPSAP